MVMNEKLQKINFKRMILAENKNEDIDTDVLIGQLGYELDSTLSFTENLHLLIDKGIIKDDLPEVDEMEKDFNYEIKHHLVDSLKYPFYHCDYENCDFETQNNDDMIEHFIEEHNLDENLIPYENPDNMDYIVLKKLIEVAFSKKYRKKKYFTISNREIWITLCESLGYKPNEKNAPSNQKPRQIIEKYGLLKSDRYTRKNILGFDKKARRIYHLNKIQLKKAVNMSDFVELIGKYQEYELDKYGKYTYIDL
jgi:hypothetical protein